MSVPLGAALLLAPAVAWPESGPVRWSGISAVGGVEPQRPTAVELVSLRLRIDLRPDGQTYLASALYELSNLSGAPEVLPVGVPLFWSRPTLEEGAERGAGPPWVEEAETAYPASVDLSANGNDVACALAGVAEASRERHPLAPSRSGWPYAEAWCQADLTIPIGRSLLSLRYPGALAFLDVRNAGDPFDQREERSLEYLLSPAAGWAGKPRMLEVTLVAGDWANHVVLKSPGGWRRSGSRYVLTIKSPDLRQLDAIRMLVKSNLVQSFNERMKMPLLGSWAATAGEAGKGRRAAPELVDGNAASQWCLPAAGSGWIELAGSARGKCALHLVLVPGRPSTTPPHPEAPTMAELDIGPCGAPASTTVRYPARATSSASYEDLSFNPNGIDEQRGSDQSGWSTHSCVHVEVKHLGAPGDEPVCVAELRPVPDCQALPPPGPGPGPHP